MNNLIILCLSFLFIVRILGLLISLDFYHNKKEIKFLIFILSWIFFIIGNMFAILINIDEKYNLRSLFLFFNIIFLELGSILYAWAIGKYYTSISNRILLFFIIISLSLTIMIFIFLNFIIISFIGALLIFCFILTIYIIPFFSKDFKKKVGKSLRWYYSAVIFQISFVPLFLIIFLQGHGFGAYNTENPFIIMTFYIPFLTISILWIILLINLEYNISNIEKSELKDQYSHNLGNIMQAISSAQELINKKYVSKEEIGDLESLIANKIKEAADLIKDIKEL